MKDFILRHISWLGFIMSILLGYVVASLVVTTQQVWIVPIAMLICITLGIIVGLIKKD